MCSRDILLNCRPASRTRKYIFIISQLVFIVRVGTLSDFTLNSTQSLRMHDLHRSTLARPVWAQSRASTRLHPYANNVVYLYANGEM